MSAYPLGCCFIENAPIGLLGLAKASSCGLTRVCATMQLPFVYATASQFVMSAFWKHVANCTLCITHWRNQVEPENFVTGEFRAAQNKAHRRHYRG
ncbi:hypothetical protein ACNKHM_11715 [Shigella sonnei]